MFEFVKAEKNKFASFHTIYTASNIFYRFDWNERTDSVIDCTSDQNNYFIYDDKKIIGGFSIVGNRINFPFIVTPFADRSAFWGATLKYAAETSNDKNILLIEIPDADSEILKKWYGATLEFSQKRMVRPTEQCIPVLNESFYFDSLLKTDKEEIIQLVYEAHAAGFTSTVWKSDIAEIKKDIEKRFNSFEQTNTLHISNTVKNKENHEIAGVCVAGIYPNAKNYSTSNFSTIHQVSVKPEYQRKGIAKAMILKAINEATAISPVITLGVLAGNPAEELYNKIGFIARANYSTLHCTV